MKGLRIKLGRKAAFGLAGAAASGLLIFFFLFSSGGRTSEETPEETFRRLVVDPIPPSVQNIMVDGFEDAGLAQVDVSFEISPEDFRDLVGAKAYEEQETDDASLMRYEASGDGRRYEITFDRKGKAWLNYSRS